MTVLGTALIPKNHILHQTPEILTVKLSRSALVEWMCQHIVTDVNACGSAH